MPRPGDLPALLYFPADRTLSLPAEQYKSPGKLTPFTDVAWRWSPATTWTASVERLLWSARWEDLSAKEEGRDEPSRFKAFADAFEAMTGGTRRLRWHQAELWVEADTGVLHPLDQLSDGEKQVLLLTAELRYRWRPGSIVLIDEPELHLHAVWQARLWQLLTDLQRERGGQVIATTQSSDLFGLVDPAQTTILGLHPLRTQTEVRAVLAAGRDRVRGFDVLDTFEQEQVAFVRALADDPDDAHARLNGKWILEHLAVLRARQTPDQCRTHLADEARARGGSPLVQDLWQRITGNTP